MDDLISRQAAIEATSEIVFVEYEDGDPRKEESIILQTKVDIRDRIKALPTVQPKHGWWKGYNTEKEGWKRTDGSPVFMSCSECNGTVLNNGSAHWNFCPNCGADMRGGSEDE